MFKSLILSLILLLTSASYSLAQGPELQEQVDELKERIASKVAELDLVEKRSLLGTVVDVSGTQITLKTISDETRFIDVDELTKFTSATSDSFGLSDIKENMTIGVIGLFNKESRRTQARLIYEEQKPPTVIYGAVYSIDDEEFTLTVAKENGAKNIVEVETLTKTSTFEDGELVKSGFSRITEGLTIIVTGVINVSDKNKIVASRIFLFPEIKASSKINLDKNIPTIPASTGSGVKLQPIAQ